MSLVRLSEERHRSVSMYQFFLSHRCLYLALLCMYLCIMQMSPSFIQRDVSCLLSVAFAHCLRVMLIEFLPILLEASLWGYMGTTRFLLCPVIFCKTDSPEITLAITCIRCHGSGKQTQSAHPTRSANRSSLWSASNARG